MIIYDTHDWLWFIEFHVNPQWNDKTRFCYFCHFLSSEYKDCKTMCKHQFKIFILLIEYIIKYKIVQFNSLFVVIFCIMIYKTFSHILMLYEDRSNTRNIWQTIKRKRQTVVWRQVSLRVDLIAKLCTQSHLNYSAHWLYVDDAIVVSTVCIDIPMWETSLCTKSNDPHISKRTTTVFSPFD